MLGKKPYEKIPHYGKCFDVAIMPWRQNRWIELCNPIKLKEYLALGKPVVSTSFPELQNYLDVTYTAKTPEEFVRCIKKALAEEISLARSDFSGGAKWFDFVFNVPASTVPVLLEFKQNAVAKVPPLVSGDKIPAQL